MTGVVPIIPRFRFNDSNGNPLAFGRVTVYLAGTTTLTNTYQDAALATKNTNPVILDANGECLFWVDPDLTYKILLQTSGLATVSGWPVDNIPGAGSQAGFNAALTAAVATATTAAGNAKTAAEAAQAAAEAASLVASTAALTAPEVYTSTAAGLAATASGDSFWVYTTAAEGLRMYRNSAGTLAEHQFTMDVTTPDDVGAGALFGDETAGIAMDFTTDSGIEVKAVDPTTPANNYTGLAKDWLSAASFPWPRRVVLRDGTQGWCDQNLALQSEDFTNASWGKSGATIATNTLTATTTTPNVNQTIGGADLAAGAHVTAEFIVSAGAASWVAIAFSGVSGRAWFDVSTGVLGAAGVDIIGQAIFTTDFNGAPLPAGRYRIRAQHKLAASLSLRLHWVDADGGTTVTVGRTINAYGCHVHHGLKACGYIKTTTAKRFLPLTWETGERTLAINAGVALVTASLWGSDLTQANWVKTNTSAALDATDDKGEPCSTLTATAIGGKCVQSTVSASTSHTVSLFIKRKTGTGTIELTADGVTWTDITSQVSASAWSRPYVKYSSTNPQLGLRFGTSGDEVYVSEFHNANRGALADAIPTYGSSVTATADVPNEAFTRFITGAVANVTAYWDFVTNDDPVATGGYGGLTAGADILRVEVSGTGTSTSLISTVSGATLSGITSDNVVGGRIETTLRATATTVLGSANGLGAILLRPAVSPVMTTLRVGGGAQQIFMRRLAVMPRAVAEDDLESWRYSGAATDSRYLVDKRIASYADVATSSNVREPSIGLLWDRQESAGGIVAYGEQNVIVNNEAPNRLRFRKFTFDKATHEITLESPYTVVEPTNWALGLGHIQSTTIHKQKHGVNKGRVHLLYTQNDSVDGLYTTANDHRRIYYRYSDQQGDDGTFSAPVVVLDKGVGSFAGLSPGGDSVEFPTDSAYPGRVVVPFYTTNTPATGILYLDPAGSWTEVAIAGGASDNEPTIFLRPNGELVITVRSSAITSRRYTVSTDGGATWSAWSDLSGDYDEVSMSTAQIDEDGDFGPYGKPYIVGAFTFGATPGLRRNLTIEDLEGSTLTPSGNQFHPYGTFRFVSYTSVRYLSGGYLLIAIESPPTTTSNARDSIRLMVVTCP